MEEGTFKLFVKIQSVKNEHRLSAAIGLDIICRICFLKEELSVA